MRNKFILALLLASLATVLVIGCSKPKNTAPPAETKSQGKGVSSEWEALKQAAEKEGEVVFTTAGSAPGANFLTALRKEWDKAGFKINLFAMNMAPPEFGKRVRTERSANQYTIDVGMTGQNTFINQFKPAGFLEPLDDKVLILPEAKDTKNWVENRLHFADEGKTVLSTVLEVGVSVWVNNKIIKPADIKSYQDLLKPEYKGKIVLGDVRLTGSPQQWLGAMMAQGIIDEAYLKKLNEQDVVISPDYNQMAQWIAQGKYPIGVGVTPDAIGILKMQGAPVEDVLTGVGAYYGSDASNLVLFNKAPHPNAAKLFINWYLTKEVQMAVIPPLRYQSARADVPTTGLPPTALLKQGVKYMDVGTEAFQKKLPEFQKIAVSVFGAPGMEQKK